MACHTASSHGDTPILIQTWFSHLNAYASTCALYPNEYPNLAFPFSLAVFFSLFSLLASFAAARPGKVQTLLQLLLLLLLLLLLWFLLLPLIVVLLLQLLLPLHVMLVVFVFCLSYITLTLPPRT